MHARHPMNLTGRDFVVGDIHGCFYELQDVLNQVRFDEAKDRLYSVGDLVDRGDYSKIVLEIATSSWFYPVLGNHEKIIIDWLSSDGNNPPKEYMKKCGSSWLIESPDLYKKSILSQLKKTPLAITLKTRVGDVGIVHACCPTTDWTCFIAALEDQTLTQERKNNAVWSRERLSLNDNTIINGVEKIIVGHTPVKKPIILGNTIHIDTHAVGKDGYLTLYDINKNEFYYSRKFKRIDQIRRII